MTKVGAAEIKCDACGGTGSQPARKAKPGVGSIRGAAGSAAARDGYPSRVIEGGATLRTAYRM